MLRIALAQINPTVGDFSGNNQKIADYITRAKSLSADVVVFPELVVTGYPPEDLLFKKHFIQDNLKTLKSLIKKTAHITAIIGFVDRDRKGQLFNAAALIHNKQLKGVYHKAELPNYGVFDEERYFSSGQTNQVFRLGQTVLGVSICEDIWTFRGPCQDQARAGANVLINISSSPFHAGKGKLREKLLIKQAQKNKTFVGYVNLVGGQDELIFDGGSCLIDPKGKMVACGQQFVEDVVVADIDPSLRQARRRSNRIKTIVLDRRYNGQGRLRIKGRRIKRLKEIEEIYQALVLGIKDYVEKNRFQKVLIGLSGGIDSALTAAIACEALGADNVVGVSMPSPYTSLGTRSDAQKLAKNLGIKCIEIPIESIYQSYLKALSGPFAHKRKDATEENIQARIRGNILMALSNKFGWLVLTTGNKSEVAVGYCTLYGDMAGGFAVIKDVPKTKVYALAKFYNEQARRDLIPKTVLKRAPSAELRENQKDQDSLPAYEVLDALLKDYVELDYSLTQMNRKRPHKLNVQMTDRVDKNEYKRRQAPPGIKITPKAFGRDRRLPITNRYKEY